MAFTQEVRLNYGILFRPKGHMSTGVQKWRHTFQFHLPQHKFKSIPPLECVDGTHVNCDIHTVFVLAFNELADTMERDVALTETKAKDLIGTKLDVPIPTATPNVNAASRRRRSTSRVTYTGLFFPIDLPISVSRGKGRLSSRSKRSAFDFIGDLASGLFGLATQGEINSLKTHINKVYQYENKLQQNQQRLMNSYMHKTNDQVHALFAAAKANHKYILKDVSNMFRQRMDSLGDLELEVTRLMAVLLPKHNRSRILNASLIFFARYSPPNPTSSILCLKIS